MRTLGYDDPETKKFNLFPFVRESKITDVQEINILDRILKRFPTDIAPIFTITKCYDFKNIVKCKNASGTNITLVIYDLQK